MFARKRLYLSTFLVLLLLFVCIVTLSPCAAGVPALISYQGKLLDASGQPAPDGVYSMRFYLYDQETGGTLLWQEPASGNPGKSVQVTAGLFNVILGSVVPLSPSSFPGNSWLQTEVNGEALTPIVRIVSSAYAIRAMSLDLPFLGTAAGAGPGFSIWNTGGGSAGFFGLSSSGSASPALEASTNGSGAALKASTTGSGYAGEFIGTINVTGAVQMDSFKLRTSPAAGYVLTSDAAGVGTWQASHPGTYTNVKSYGATGDGVTDDTQAIRNAMDAAYARRRTGTYPGGPMYISTAILFFPAGKYVISDTIELKADVLGEGAIIYQTKGTKNIFYSASVWRTRIAGISFVGGWDHLNLGTGNVDTSEIIIEKCHFSRASDCAIRMQVGSDSTHLIIRDSVFTYCNQVLVNHCTLAKISDCWISSAGYMIDQAVIENHPQCVLVAENIVGVPAPVTGNDQRWIDNYGSVTCRNFRFGGEQGGFTPVVNFVHYGYTAPLAPDGVVLDNCQVYAVGNQARICAVYCEEIPNQIVIRDCVGFQDMPVLVKVRSSIDLNTYFDNAVSAHLRFLVDADNVAVQSRDLPEQMRPYQSNQIEADSVPTTGKWVAGTFVRNRNCSGTGSPYGWMCITSGKPGVWNSVNVAFQ